MAIDIRAAGQSEVLRESKRYLIRGQYLQAERRALYYEGFRKPLITGL